MLPLLLEPEAFQEHLNRPEILLIDLCRRPVYDQCHLPGALHISPEQLVSGIKPATGKLPSLARLESLFGDIGYDRDKQVVVYDDEGGGWAGRFIWTLDVIGHSHSSYLNGGLTAWLAAGLPVTDEVPTVNKTSVSLTVHPDVIAEQADVLAAIDDPTVLIWDARSAEEYAGMRSAAARNGHIPGAINLDWLALMDQDNNLRLKPGLENLLTEHGFTRDKANITHCQTHHRSGLTWLVGKMLGYDIRGYHGSWSEWGNDPDTPIATP